MSSLSAMGEAFAALWKQHPAKPDTHSGNLDPLNRKTKKPCDDVVIQVKLAVKAMIQTFKIFLKPTLRTSLKGVKTLSVNTQDSYKNGGKDKLKERNWPSRHF